MDFFCEEEVLREGGKEGKKGGRKRNKRGLDKSGRCEGDERERNSMGVVMERYLGGRRNDVERRERYYFGCYISKFYVLIGYWY